MCSIASDKDYTDEPCIKGHLDTPESVNQITNHFIEKCNEMGLDESEYAVVFRGQKFGETNFGLVNNDNSSRQNSPWINGHYGVRDIVYGKYLIDHGKYTDGLSLIEKGCYKITKRVRYVSSSTMRREIAEVGFRRHRAEMFDFIYAVDSVFLQYKKAVICKEWNKLLYNGNRMKKDMFVSYQKDWEQQKVRIYDEEGRFIGIYEYSEIHGDYKPVKLFMEA